MRVAKVIKRANILIDKIKKGESFKGVDMDSLVNKQAVEESLARTLDTEEPLTKEEAINLFNKGLEYNNLILRQKGDALSE